MNQHPVVKKYELKTYSSKYDNQRCAISGEDIPRGVRIANVAPLMSVLNALGLISTKVFKYAQVALLPMLATARETELVRQAATRLLDMTDPKWPKDYVGCSASSFHPVNNWVSMDCHELGTQRAARALMQHVGTQIAEDSDEAEAIKAVAARTWKTEKVAEPEAPAADDDATCDEGFVVRNSRRSGEVFVDAPTKSAAEVSLDPPWENKDHGRVKDALKGLGARWDNAKRVWAIAVTALAVALKDLDSLELREASQVTVTPRALDALRIAWAKADEQSQDDGSLVTINGRRARVQNTPRRKKGEVLVDVNGTGMKVLFDYPNTDRLQRLKNDVKNLGGRWDPKAKCWKLGANSLVENIETLFEGMPLVLTDAAVKAMEEVMERRSLSAAMDLDDDELKDAITASLPEGKELFPFQAAGVAFLQKSGGRALIGDEMGTGKTIQTAAFLGYRKDLRPAVVVVPAVVSTNWVKELEAWTEGESIYRVKNGKDEVPAGTTVVVVTYDLAKRRLEALQALQPKVVVADECHYLKNVKAQRTQGFMKLVETPSVESVVMLSGTPITNRPKEFFTALKMLRPDEFNSWFKYTEKYCDGHYTKWGYKCDGATNTAELASRLKDVMIRRLKKDVLEELPSKLRGRVQVEIAAKARAAYNRALREADTPLTQITAGRHALGLAKVAPAVEMAKDYADQGNPLLIFAHHKDVMDELCDGLRGAEISFGRIDGTVSAERRGELVQRFQDGGLDAMVLSSKAAGVGITLTRASDVLVVERQWEPATEEQAEDRAHRIGQTSSVTVRYMVVTDSMDEDMDALIDSKRAVLDAVLNQGKSLPEEKLDIRKELMAAVAKRVMRKRKTNSKAEATQKGGRRNVRKRA